jgi:hypothetical protein
VYIFVEVVLSDPTVVLFERLLFDVVGSNLFNAAETGLRFCVGMTLLANGLQGPGAQVVGS